MTVFVAVMLPVVVSLGFWQLDRGAGKRLLEQRSLARLGMLPVAAPERVPNAPDTDFLRVRLRGRYESGHHYLVDNRVQRGQPGYWVVTRFRARDGRVFLVNRGWIEAPASRDVLPSVDGPPEDVSITGVLWPDMGLPPLLAEDPWPTRWPRRVQRLDVARMAAQGQGAAPVEVRLEAGQPGVLSAAPVDVDFHPERHSGYAIQWFALAVVLAVGYGVFGLRRRHRSTDEAS